MTKTPALLRFLGACMLATSLGVASLAEAQYQPWAGGAVINDPEWQKRFLGSYGFLSGAEPEINTGELEILREVIDLLKANPRAASAVLEQHVSDTSSAALDFILANLNFQNGELGPAKTRYASAIAKFPDFRRAHKNLGLLLVQEQDFDAALEHLSRAVELGDRDGRNYGLMGYCLINQENYLAAQEAYRQAILAEPKVQDWKLGLARSLLAMEEFAEANALFETLIKENPTDASNWLLQANALVGLERPLQAAENLEAVRLLGKAQSSSLVLLGDIYMNAGMFDLAKSAYVEVIESDQGGSQFSTAYRAADLLVRTRAFDQASEVLETVDRRYATNLGEDDQLRVLTLKAKIARAQGRKQEAAEVLESIVKRDGTRGDALLELAKYHRDQGNTEKAILLIERAARLEAYEYQALLDHAQLLVSERDYGEAAELLRKALRIKDEPRVQRFLERVEAAIVPS